VPCLPKDKSPLNKYCVEQAGKQMPAPFCYIMVPGQSPASKRPLILHDWLAAS